MSLKSVRLVAPLVGLLGAATATPGSAQRVFAYSEPTTCTSFFKPVGGLTFHAGETFNVAWYINFPQFGPVDYYGQPDPVISTDGTKRWTTPTANVTCFLDWYYTYPGSPQMDTYYRWHINFYGGTVSNCSGSTQLQDDPGGPYDPYSEWGDTCSDDPTLSGSGGEGGGGGADCHEEWVVIEISYDDGGTWETWWEGYATVCG
jgi:hypothetical protein